jgi:hypothetical protein
MKLKWKLYDENMGAPDTTRREWKGRSDADRKAGANDNAPWRSDKEISKGHHEDLTNVVRGIFGTRVYRTSQPSRRRDNRLADAARKLDAAIGAVSSMPDEPNWNESTAEAFVRIRREQGMSDKQIEREARVGYHSDRQPQNLRGTADAFVAEVSQILRRR